MPASEFSRTVLRWPTKKLHKVDALKESDQVGIAKITFAPMVI